VTHLTAASGLSSDVLVWIDNGGTWGPVALDAAVASRHGRGAPGIWVRLHDAAELGSVAERLGIPAEALRRSTAGGPGTHATHPHLERLPGGGTYLSIPTLSYVEATQDVLTGSLLVVLADNVIFTCEEGGAGTLEAAALRLNSSDVPAESGARLVLAVLLLELVGAASDVELSLGEAVADTEDLVFSASPADPVQRIYSLKREIAEARHALVPFSAEFTELVAHDEDARRGGEAKPWLLRLAKSVDRLDRRLEGHDSLLADMLSASLSRISVRQNEDMRKISAWAAIAAVPTLVAGVYGMNFRHMPELGWTWGYPATVAGMALACFVLYRVFKRSGWL